MNSFGALPPLDIEPLPSLFPFSPCAGGPYKYVRIIFYFYLFETYCITSANIVLYKNVGILLNRWIETIRNSFQYDWYIFIVQWMWSVWSKKKMFLILFALLYLQRTERPSHDMADVLLSLKHAVLKPSPDPHQMQSQNYNHPQASLSYTVHPQILMSPTQSQAQTSNYNSMNYYENQCSGQHQHVSPPSMYPSMSVNVSMNMTMHGYGSDTVPMQCSQVKKEKITLEINVQMTI